MAESWDIERYVSGHPDDHEQRWRLAKKLYKECEYRLAVEHLLLLEKKWVRKVNVMRYLAAAHYRLGRYDAAVAELKEAIGIWPKEIGLREQLGRVLEVSGRSEEAAIVWDEIVKLAPQSSLGSRAARRRRGGTGAPVYEDLDLFDSDSGTDLRRVQVCPSCGAQNDDELDRCWQCHAALGHGITPPPHPVRRAFSQVSPRVWTTGSGIAAGALLSAGAFLSVQRLIEVRQSPLGLAASATVYDVLANTFATTRVLVGLAVLIAWPVAVRIAVGASELPNANRANVYSTGLFLAALAYLGSWAPIKLAICVPILLLVVSFAAIVIAFRLSFKDAAIVWLVQGVLVSIVALASFISIEGTRPLKECLAVVSYGVQHDAQEQPGIYKPSPGKTPLELKVQWDSTGSSWLDECAGAVQFEVLAQRTDTPLLVEFKDDTRPYLYDDMDPLPFTFTQKVAPNHNYYLLITGHDAVDISVVVKGALRPRFGS